MRWLLITLQSNSSSVTNNSTEKQQRKILPLLPALGLTQPL